MYFVEVQTRGEAWESPVPLHNPYSTDTALYSGKLTQVLNAVSDFTFSILPNHPLFDVDLIRDGIYPLRAYGSRVRITDEKGNIIFRGRVIDSVLKMTGDGALAKEYTVEDELAFLVDSKQRVWEYHGISPAEYLGIILNNHNASVAGDGEYDKTIKLGKVEVTNTTDNMYRYLAYESSLKNINDDLLSSMGGYIKLRYDDTNPQYPVRYLDYTVESGELVEMSIELAVNLRSIESQFLPSEIITRLIPLGAEIDSVHLSIAKLTNAGIIAQESYWLENYSRVEWVGQLLINLSKLNYNTSIDNGISDVSVAISSLANAGAINSPEYWLEHYGDLGDNIEWLLIKAATDLNMANAKNPNADASKIRLTVAQVNGGRDYIDDKSGLVLEFGIIEGMVVWDDVTLPENLLVKGKEWLEAQRICNSVSISALDLSEINVDYDSFVVGNLYKCKNELLGIDTEYRLTEQVIDIVNPMEGTLTFGDRLMTLSDYSGNLGSLG